MPENEVKCRLCAYRTPKWAAKAGKARSVWQRNLSEHYFKKHEEEFFKIMEQLYPQEAPQDTTLRTRRNR